MQKLKTESAQQRITKPKLQPRSLLPNHIRLVLTKFEIESQYAKAAPRGKTYPATQWRLEDFNWTSASAKTTQFITKISQQRLLQLT